MEDKTLYYYRQGYNCSQCLIKAFENEYKIPVSKQLVNSCKAINSGFGVGGICSVLIAGFMVFGLLFDEKTAKRLRMKLINDFTEKHGAINCIQLTKTNSVNDCETVIKEAAKMVREIIEQELPD